MPNPALKDKNNFLKLQKKLRRLTGQAISEYSMIEDGDKVMVCMSGGKDSYTMLDILMQLKRSAPIHFDLIAVNLDQKQPGFPEHILPNYLSTLNVPYEIIEEDTYSIVKQKVPEGKTTCALCSRLRRGIIYSWAKKNNITKIALGHHRDDIVETLFLNMFYGGRMKAMPPKLISDNGEHIVIRPLSFCKEKDIAIYAQQSNFPIIPCNLCGSQENLQRKHIKSMLNTWDTQFPGRVESIFKSLRNVSKSHLADTQLYNYHDLLQNMTPLEEGDTVFDSPDVPVSPLLSDTQVKEQDIIKVKSV